MKCPKCGIEVEKGSLYCPKCLAEVPWVSEYSTLETLMKREEISQQEDTEVKEETPGIKKTGTHKKRLKKRTIFFWSVLLGVFFVSAGAHYYIQNHSYFYLYQKACKAYQAKEYEETLEYTQRALEVEKDSVDASILMAKSMDHLGDPDSAVVILQKAVEDNPDSLEVYQELVYILEKKGAYEEIKILLSKCSNAKILKAMSDYICEDPVPSVETGVYSETFAVEIEADAEYIYYTLDGSEPTEKSMLYTGPIPIEEGVTELKVYCVNEKNIPSDKIYRKYMVYAEKPQAPVVTPAGGEFHKKTHIEMSVPAGCTGYYAFDKIPTKDSTKYTGPVNMPEGVHTFYGIVISQNGKASDVTSVTYNLN